MCFIHLSSIAFGQSKARLETNQRLLAKEISLTQKQLSSLSKDRSNSLEHMQLLRHEIQNRDLLIENLNLQIDLQDANIVAREAEINLVKDQYDKMKYAYKEFVRDYYRTRFQYNPLVFIFSADSIVKAWKRMIYYRNLSQYQQLYISDLQEKESHLLIELNELETVFEEKKQNLATLEDQRKALERSRKKRESTLKEIKQNEQFLTQRLNAKLAQKRKLDQRLAALVESSMAGKSNMTKLPDAIRKLNNAFGANKGKLPWPVAQGYISRKFGKQRHPELKMIFITNNGIDIVTEQSEPVKTVFEGNVIAIQNIAGFQKTILINHGTYYSVYANVEDVAVSKGEKVKRGQVIAYAAASASNISNIHFEIWQGRQLLNPAHWLQKK
ncbi:MAG: peptidoglycan DD-metalloendopeptidase family protein [Bacteroidia bacterium]|nr:peptidoglycan DD-metalloendopeptidase family protein [Bacteroidia bacterium]